MNTQDTPEKFRQHAELPDISERSSEQLLEAVLGAGERWSEKEQAMVVGAYELAGRLHARDKYNDEPYENHLLRVANRVIEGLGINDPEIVAAALLHDIVEDHSLDVLVHYGSVRAKAGDLSPRTQQSKAIALLGDNFSPNVAEIVGDVTSQAVRPRLQDAQWQKLTFYRGNVRKAIETPPGWAVKFCDWYENISSVDLNDNSKRARWLLTKYNFVAPVIAERYTVGSDIQDMLSLSAREYVESCFGESVRRVNMSLLNNQAR